MKINKKNIIIVFVCVLVVVLATLCLFVLPRVAVIKNGVITYHGRTYHAVTQYAGCLDFVADDSLLPVGSVEKRVCTVKDDDNNLFLAVYSLHESALYTCAPVSYSDIKFPSAVSSVTLDFYDEQVTIEDPESIDFLRAIHYYKGERKVQYDPETSEVIRALVVPRDIPIKMRLGQPMFVRTDNEWLVCCGDDGDGHYYAYPPDDPYLQYLFYSVSARHFPDKYDLPLANIAD